MFDGRPRLLIVEDEFLIAMDVESMVQALGCTAIGPAGSVEGALATVREARLDGAILDINLGGTRVWPVAALLEARGVPFVFVSGYTQAEMPARFRAHPMLSKPLSVEALRAELTALGIIGA